jgi:hypothetical protein
MTLSGASFGPQKQADELADPLTAFLIAQIDALQPVMRGCGSARHQLRSQADDRWRSSAFIQTKRGSVAAWARLSCRLVSLSPPGKAAT